MDRVRIAPIMLDFSLSTLVIPAGSANPPLPAVKCRNTQEQFDDIRVEAAHLITSLSRSLLRRLIHRSLYRSVSFPSHGSPEGLCNLLHVNAHQVSFYAISCLDLAESTAIKPAFARAFRTIAMACAELVGPS